MPSTEPSGGLRVLYVCGTYAPDHGGAEISARTILRQLARRGDTCVALTQCRAGLPDHATADDGIEVIRCSHERRREALIELIASRRPHVLLTQLMWSDVALAVAADLDVPVVLRVCNIPSHGDLSVSSPAAPTAVVAVSEAVRRDVLTRSRREATIIAPPIDPAEVVAIDRAPADEQFIAMFNPIEIKGPHIFARVAQMMPGHRFAVIPGWSCLRDNGGQFDGTALERLCESIGQQYSGDPPHDYDFTGIPNVVVLAPEDDQRLLYRRIRVLCMPSVSPEAFGRVAAEAVLNAIPVVASDIGGLGEHVRVAGIAIREFEQPEHWVEALTALDSDSFYDEIVARGQRVAEERFGLDACIDRWREVLVAATRAGRARPIDASVLP